MSFTDMKAKLKIGDRISINVTVANLSSYTVPSKFNKGTETLWRHLFKDNDGNTFVYSGRHMNLQPGDKIRIKGTVKRFETAFKNVRLSRVRILDRYYGEQGELI